MFSISTKTIFLHLAVSFVLIEKGKTESSKTGFSCTFEDEKYKLETNTPIWSTQNTPADKYFSMSSEFKEFRSYINQAMKTVMEKRPLNNVDHFIRFIKAYKNQTGKSLESFFNDYHVPFQPLEDPVSFLVEINRELMKKYPDSKDLMFLASAYVDPPETFVRGVLNSRALFNLFGNVKSAEAMLKKDRFQRHVAGIINMGHFKEKGIVLLDPGYIDGNQRVNPFSVILMENNRSYFDGDGLYGGVMAGEIKFNVHLRDIFALVSETPSKTQQRTKVLYLRNKPFCSFMDSTTKGNLLIPNYGIMNFDNEGSPKGYLTFNIVPQKVYAHEPFFRIGTFNERTEEYLAHSIPFDSIKPVGMKPDIKNEINKAIAYLGLKPEDDLLAKLQTIQTEVFQDQNLVMQIYELTKKLNQKTNESDQKTIIFKKIQTLFIFRTKTKSGKSSFFGN